MNDLVGVASGGACRGIRFFGSLQTGVEKRAQRGGFEIGGEVAIFHAPANTGRLEGSHTRIEHGAPKVSSKESRDDFGIHFADQDGFQILRPEAPAPHRLTIQVLRHVRFGVEQLGRLKNRLLEGKVLKRVQGIVVNEYPDGSLRREKMRHVLQRLM